MTFHDNNPNRPTNDPYVRRPMADGGMGYGIPLGLLAIAVIVGALFMWPTNTTTTTARNDAPMSRQVNPSTTPPAPVPAPTPPAKTQ
jgi:hypothetical protein